MERQGFLSFMDMIDGGGMGASGDEFKGGGLLSDIANALFQPAGYRDRMRGRQEVRPMARPAGMTQPAPVASPMSNPITPMMRNEDLAMSMPVTPAAPRPANMGMTPMGGMAAPAPMAAPQSITFEQFVAGLGPVAQTASPMALRQAYDQFLMGY